MDDKVRQHIALGRQHYHAGEYMEAERHLGEVVEQYQTFPDVYNMLGVIYHADGRFDQAELAFENALRLNENYTEAALNLSVVYNDRGKYAKARSVYQRVMERAVNEPRQLDAFARGKIANMHADLGAVYASMGMYPESVNEYRKALELGPTFVDLRTRLGVVYRDMGDHASAVRELERACEQNRHYLPARTHLGVALFSMGRKRDAIAAWNAVLAADPTDKSARLYLRIVADDSADNNSER